MSHTERHRDQRPSERQGHLIRELLEALFKPLLREVVDERLHRTNERIDHIMAELQDLRDAHAALQQSVTDGNAVTVNALGDIATKIQALTDRIAELEAGSVTPEDLDGLVQESNAIKAQVDSTTETVKAADPNPDN